MPTLATSVLGAKGAVARPSPSAAFQSRAPPRLTGKRRTLGCNCNTRLADVAGAAGAAGAPVADQVAAAAEYFSAGQSWCRFSVMQRDIIAAGPAESRRVPYVDCTPGSADAAHAACQVAAKGFPYLVKCAAEGNDCAIVKYGVQSLAQLEALAGAPVQ